jgi:hypothetical protein
VTGNLNGVKPNERVIKRSEEKLSDVKMGRSEVSKSLVK